jgi:hypothetical protein
MNKEGEWGSERERAIMQKITCPNLKKNIKK